MASINATQLSTNQAVTDPAAAPRIAVVGCGYWGKNLVRNFAELGHLAAISDANDGLAEAMADQHRAKALGWQAVLDAPDIDGVVIAAPAEQHAKLTWQALEAGKHVFVEKPIALNTDDARRSMALAEKRDLTLMVGHLLHYHPAFNALQTMVADRVFGRLQYIYSNRLNLGKIRREENILWSFAPHDLSMILALAGELPSAVQATGSCYMHESIADVTTTNLAFANGINAHIFVSWLHPFKEQKLIVIGDEGMAVFDDRQDWSNKLVLFPHKIDWPGGIPEPIRAEGRPVPLDEAEPLRLECQHFLECIAKRQRPRTDGREALDVLRVLSAAQKSINEGREIALSGERGSSVAGNAFVHESAYVDAGVGVGQGSKIWHFSHILGGSDIGKGCTIGQNVMIGPDVKVGDGCKIQNNVSLYKGVELEEGVFCGPSCVFTNVNNPRAEVERKDQFKPTLVKKGATIGANATIVCGHTLGRYSFIAAGAVVTEDVPDYALMAGVPARRIGWMSAEGERLDDDLRCPRTGETYRETPDGRLEPTESQARRES